MTTRKIVDNIFLISGTAVIGKKYFFTPDPEINNSILGGLTWYSETAIDSSFYIGYPGFTPISNGNSKVTFITLCDKKGVEIHKDLPLYTLAPEKNNGIVRENFFNSDIDISKSYVKFRDTAAPIANIFLLLQFILYPKPLTRKK